MGSSGLKTTRQFAIGRLLVYTSHSPLLTGLQPRLLAHRARFGFDSLAYQALVALFLSSFGVYPPSMLSHAGGLKWTRTTRQFAIGRLPHSF